MQIPLSLSVVEEGIGSQPEHLVAIDCLGVVVAGLAAFEPRTLCLDLVRLLGK